MKAFKVGIMAAAILLVAAGVGFGIAQAGGNQSERPVSSFEEMAALEQGGNSASSAESRPVLAFEDQESYRVATRGTEDLESPIETGAIPEPSWMKEYGHD